MVESDCSWDVIVVGGGPSGCTAATAAAREGAKTLLVEMTGALGGMGTLGLVPWFCGFVDGEKMIARGLAEQVLYACRDHTPHLRKAMEREAFPCLAIDPELLKRVYDDLVTQAGAEVLFLTQLAAVEKSSESEIEAVIVASKAGLHTCKAKVYVDCTGDGDLAAWAGASFEKGDELGEMQPATHCFIITNVDDYGLNNGPAIHFFDPESPVHKAIRSPDYPLIDDLHSCSTQIGPGTYGFNTGHVYDVDHTDPVSVSRGLVQGRKLAAQYRDAFAAFHPAFANSFLVATGGLLGARETRRITGDYVLTVDDYLARRGFADEICRNAYNIDVHSSKDVDEARAGMTLQEIEQDLERRIKPYGKGESFGVPYRCLTPKGLSNVLVAGRCISTDRQVNGSVRIMACCLTTGEAAGTAAAMASAGSHNVHAVDTDALRGKLKAQGAYLPDMKDAK